MASEHDHRSTLDGGHRAAGPERDGALTRRTALGAAGAGGVALLFGGLQRSAAGRLLDALGPDVAEAASGTCVMTPAKTVGPYFVDEKLNRSDVRANTSDGAVQAGVPLKLTLQVFDADDDCAPVKGATVDIWHANASGLYSDEAANGTSGQNWLRGYQTTDADGLVTFTTIYPGWYSGRAVHIHFKVRVYDGSTETLEFTSQLFFTDAMNTAVLAANAPYYERAGKLPDTTDATDNIYGTDGASLLLAPVADGSGGYTADFSVGISAKGGGGSSGSASRASDRTVRAVLKSVAMIRTRRGTRRLRLKIRTKERVAVTARVKRGRRIVAVERAHLAAGTRTVGVTIPSSTRAGAARLRLMFTDAAGNTKHYSRTVHIHARRS